MCFSFSAKVSVASFSSLYYLSVFVLLADAFAAGEIQKSSSPNHLHFFRKVGMKQIAVVVVVVVVVVIYPIYFISSCGPLTTDYSSSLWEAVFLSLFCCLPITMDDIPQIELNHGQRFRAQEALRLIKLPLSPHVSACL